MKKVVVIVLAGVVLITGIILFIVFNSKTSYYNIKIMDSVGTVEVDRDNDTLETYEGMKMRDKDYLRVASDGFSRIDCDRETYSHFEHDSEASFVADSDKKLMINLVKGEMVIELQKKLTYEESLMVKTPNTTIALRGTVVAVRTVLDENGNVRTINYCLEGRAELMADCVSDELEAGEGWLVVTNDLGKIVESRPILADEFEFAGIDINSLKGADNAPMVLNYSGVEDNPELEPIELNETNFPDLAFRNYLAENIDVDKDGKLSMEEQIFDTLYVTGLGIKDLKGIEYFGMLRTLSCSNNELETIDLRENKHLDVLYCGYNKISNINLSNCIELEVLQCDNNLIEELDVSNCMRLRYILAESNQLGELDVSNNLQLNSLKIKNNTIENIDLSKNIVLEILHIDRNRLKGIDLSNNTKLKILNVGANDLTGLDVSKNTELTELDCYSNKLTSIDLNNNKELEILKCNGNDLSDLDVSNNTKLTLLDCGSNNLTKLDISKNTQLNK